jgi:hypothetical protein
VWTRKALTYETMVRQGLSSRRPLGVADAVRSVLRCRPSEFVKWFWPHRGKGGFWGSLLHLTDLGCGDVDEELEAWAYAVDGEA